MNKKWLAWNTFLNSNNCQNNWQDCVFLSLIMLISMVLYIGKLGFYSDDWAFLGGWILAEDQSPLGLMRAFYSPLVAMRPVQTIYLSLLYWLFELNPIGYHLVNSAVFISGVLLFYLMLRQLRQNRLLALTLPMVYGLLPHYSTDRFWMATFQANLSMTLYFLSLYSDLRMLQARPKYLWLWKLISLLSLFGSTLAYEVFLPLFLLNPLLVLYHKRQLHSVGLGLQIPWRKLAALLGSNLLSLLLVVVFKLLATIRLEGNSVNPIEQIKNITRWSLIISVREYGLGLPRIIWRILQKYPNPAILTLGVVLSLIILSYLSQLINRSSIKLLNRKSICKLIGLNLIVYGLGYAIFINNSNVGFTTTGISNRTAIAAAIGVAGLWVVGLAWVSSLINSIYLQKYFFCILITLLCFSGFLINNTIALFWIDAYHKQQEIIADVRQAFPTFPAGSTLILDGICPYMGPGIVFESNWDLMGVLRIIYRDLTLKSDVVTSNLKVEKDGLTTLVYGNLNPYPYNQNLFIYNFTKKKITRLVNAETAHSYFAQFNPDYSNGCPKGHEGKGVPIF
ncbi:MAG TPA: hypothetical protein V6C95_22745 [Coleofasciculaceae cyanobacterium]